MNFELFIARTWIFLPALLVLFITGAAAAIVIHYIMLWRTRDFNDVSSNVWVALTVAVVLDLLLFAVMDVGQAFAFVTDGWGAIVGVCSTVLLPLLGYKAATKISSTKGGATDVTGGS